MKTLKTFQDLKIGDEIGILTDTNAYRVKVVNVIMGDCCPFITIDVDYDGIKRKHTFKASKFAEINPHFTSYYADLDVFKSNIEGSIFALQANIGNFKEELRRLEDIDTIAI